MLLFRQQYILVTIILFFFSCHEGKKVEITGELNQWHKTTFTIEGPTANESDTLPNPFLDYRMTGIFTHESGSPSYTIPGYFAADGSAGETSAEVGNKWRVHLSPDKAGIWNYQIIIESGKDIAISEKSGDEVVSKAEGSFQVNPSNKTSPDFRSEGRLQYVGKRYLQFAGSGRYFLKAGADSPENLLAFKDFDGTWSNKEAGIQRNGEAATTNLKIWEAHVRDWNEGDPAWKNGKGKGLIGALNYLAGTGCNVFSFLTYNVGGDGDDVWPYVSPTDKFHFDCSKLDQWQIVFDYGQELGLYLHFKLQETENDDDRHGKKTSIPAALDGGDLGPERKVYLRELVARFGYELALNWNLGEENTQSTKQQEDMASYIKEVDPYDHHIVLHTYPNKQDSIYPKLLGPDYTLTGLSLQNSWEVSHQRIIQWNQASKEAGKQWVVAHDEQNPHYTGVPPDEGYEGFSGLVDHEKVKPYTLHDIRKYTLWGTFMAGGAGGEYYFGYTLPQNDLGCQDWRSRDESWKYAGIALDFFNQYIPFWEMENRNDLIGNPENTNEKYCLAKPGETYIIYLPQGGSTDLNLEDIDDSFSIQWFNPRTGGELINGSIENIKGPGQVNIGLPPEEVENDWAVLIQRDDLSK